MAIFSTPLFVVAFLFTNTSATLLRRASDRRNLQNVTAEDRGGQSKNICSSLPSINKSTAPSGAKLQLYGSCETIDAAFNGVTFGYLMSGLCQVFNTTAHDTSIGTMRYTLDSVFDSTNLIQTFSMMRLFDQIVLTSSASSYPLDNGPYLDTVVTFGIFNVVVDVGLAENSSKDCGFSKYKKFVLSNPNGDGTGLTFTFF
jgi:small basic protein